MPPSAEINAAVARYPTIQVSRLALREGNRKRPVYTMHKWWARRLGAVFRMIILTERQRVQPTDTSSLWEGFYAPSALPDRFRVLDPFLGGGTTLVEAAKQGAHCIGVDIDPVACFITKMELAPIEAARVQAGYQEIAAQIDAELRPLYKTRRRGRSVDVVHYFWVDVITCPACRTETDAHPTFQLAHDTAAKKQTVVCPRCDSIAVLPLRARWNRCRCGQATDLKAPPVRLGRFTCPHCRSVGSTAGLSAEGMVAPRLFALEYLTAGGERGFQSATDEDRAIYGKAAKSLRRQSPRLPIPAAPVPVAGRSDRRPLLYGIRRYRDLFNDRQLFGLGVIARAIKDTKDRDVRNALALAFSHALASNNMFCGWAFGYRRLTPLFGVHAFRKVTRPVEGNLLGLPVGRGSFANAVRAVVRGYEYMAEPFEYRYKSSRPVRVKVQLPSLAAKVADGDGVRILNRSSTDLSPIADDSIDLVLTDPPYFDNLSYSELSDFYHVWLRKLLGDQYVGYKSAHTPIGAALYGGNRRGLGRRAAPKEEYTATLLRILGECRRVLKPDGALVFTFHHRSPDAWEGLGTALLRAGFSIDDVIPVRSEGKSGFHSYEGTIKWDSVFFCRLRSEELTWREGTGHLTRAANRAVKMSNEWRLRLRRSRLDFSLADQNSLGMSLALREFSRNLLDPSLLPEVLARVSAAIVPEQAKTEVLRKESC